MPFRDLPGVVKCRFKRGDCLIRAGEPVEYVYYLLSGTVYKELVSSSGRISVLNSKAKGNIAQSAVGIAGLYREASKNGAMFDLIAHTNCVAYQVPREVCKEYLRKNPELLEEIVSVTLDEYYNLLRLFQAKEEGQVAGRLCSLLLERAKETEHGMVVSRKLTNVEMAKFLSVHKVTVARILRALKEEGVIERIENGLLLKNPEQLQVYANYEMELKYK